jgi:hypothetical protein
MNPDKISSINHKIQDEPHSIYLVRADGYLLLILRVNKIGGHLSIVLFLIGLAVDILVANVMLVYIQVGLLIGWVILAPLIFGGDDIFEQDDQ